MWNKITRTSSILNSLINFIRITVVSFPYLEYYPSIFETLDGCDVQNFFMLQVNYHLIYAHKLKTCKNIMITDASTM